MVTTEESSSKHPEKLEPQKNREKNKFFSAHCKTKNMFDKASKVCNILFAHDAHSAE
jgi:hypothetical protein